jgi:hypothetical protein
MNSNFNEVLQEINSSKSTLTSYSPSRKENVDILPLTLSQQKSIIESSADSTLGALFFNNTFFKIFKQNIKGDITKYDTIDRVNFSLQLRSQLSNTYTVNDVKVNLTDIIQRNKSINYELTEQKVSSDNFTFTIKNPSLTLDDKINTLLLNRYKNENINSTKMKTLISDIYVYEILKFIPKLKINDKEIDLHQDITNAATIIESIDGNRFNDIMVYINKVRDTEKLFTAIPGTNYSIDIIPGFFIV